MGSYVNWKNWNYPLRKVVSSHSFIQQNFLIPTLHSPLHLLPSILCPGGQPHALHHWYPPLSGFLLVLIGGTGRSKGRRKVIRYLVNVGLVLSWRSSPLSGSPPGLPVQVLVTAPTLCSLRLWVVKALSFCWPWNMSLSLFGFPKTCQHICKHSLNNKFLYVYHAFPIRILSNIITYSCQTQF